MKVKIFDKIYEVEHICYCEEEKGTYYYLKGKKTPYCDLDYDIEIINESKELTPLDACKIIREHDFPMMIATMPPIPATMSGKTEGELWEIIETALKDYEMEHTLRIRLENINYELVREKQGNDKKLKAFEIIKEKRVDITFFDTYVKWNWEKYLNRKLKCSEKELTQAEFDLLKEVL